jgi:hypothetical protein
VLLEHFKLRRWLWLGAGRLGDEAVLWGRRIANRSQLGEGAELDSGQLVSTPDPVRDPLLLHAGRFSVFVPARLARDGAERSRLERLIRDESPAHTEGRLVLVEPRMRIGVQSSIGFDTAVGRWPAGVELDGARLDRDAVLTEPDQRPGSSEPPSPGLRVGRRARIGGSTRLD